MKKYKFIDLFAGCGGLEDGFLQSGRYIDIAAVEWLKPQVNTLIRRLETKWKVEDAAERVMHFDIQRETELFAGWDDEKFGSGKGLDYFVNKAQGIDVIIGGPPCQAYSIAGRVRDENGMRDDYRNYLFEHYLSVVNRYRPKVFVFENVPGILSAAPDGTPITDLIKQGFANIGYDIIGDLKITKVNASDYGVPQNRERMIIVGIDNRKYKNTQRMLNTFYKEILPKYTCIEKMLYKEKAKLFVMNYQNKTQMHDWLESLGIVKLDPNSGEVIDEVALNEEDIDAYHITNAYLTVKKWLENTYDYKAIGAEIREKIRTYTRFIWYEINGDVKPEIIFTNINMGKIKLTNAELIKALLLKKDNYKGESEKEITASQIKISTAWDNMEATLQREDMWRFLTGSGKFSSIDTHMELIFQIMANEIIKSRVEKYPEFYIENEKQLNRETYTFIIFNREIEYMKREYVDVGDYKYSKMLEDFWGKVERAQINV